MKVRLLLITVFACATLAHADPTLTSWYTENSAALARVIHGADEITRGVDITVSTRAENLRRLDLALDEINARRRDGSEPAVRATDFGTDPRVLRRLPGAGLLFERASRSRRRSESLPIQYPASRLGEQA